MIKNTKKENIVMISKTSGKIFRGLTRQKRNFLEVVCPVMSDVKLTAFQKVKQTVRHGGGGVMVFRTWTT